MDKKPRITPNDTFVFDDADLEEFDELSMTAVIGEVTNSFRNLPQAGEGSEPPAKSEAEKSSAAAEQDGDRAGGRDGFDYDPEIMALMNELDDEK